MSGKWTGGSVNRMWIHGDKPPNRPDPARDRRLWAEMAGMAFWCETCGDTHPLAEHAACRNDPGPVRAREAAR